jgi:hypothetical protein
MSKRLWKVLNEFLLVNEEEGERKLRQAVKRSSKTLHRWMKKGLPKKKPALAFKLAVAAGVTKEEALKLAQEECPFDECPSDEAKETA